MHEVCWVRSQRIELCQDKLVDRVDDQRTDDHAWDVSDASNDDHGQVNHRVAKAEIVRRDAAQLGGVVHTGDTREEGTGSKGEQLRSDKIDAGGSCRDLILTNGDPGTTKTRVAQADVREDREAD